MRLPEQDQEIEQEKMEERESLLQKPVMTRILLGIIAILLICILVLLLMVSIQNRQKPKDLQQNITDYAKQQENLEQTLEEEPRKEEIPAPGTSDESISTAVAAPTPDTPISNRKSSRSRAVWNP